MKNYPEKLRIVPDNRMLRRAGRLADGRFMLQMEQHDPANRDRKFLASYVFDANGALVDDAVSLIGQADDFSDGTMSGAIAGHAKVFGSIRPDSFDIVPFSIARHGLTFGLVAREDFPGDDEDEDGDPIWTVEALPGVTMNFRAPFDSGSYEG